jgi:hypothetical protein
LIWWSPITRNAYWEWADSNLSLLSHVTGRGGGGWYLSRERQIKVKWECRSYVGCGNILQAVSRLWVLACVRGSSVACSVCQNVCHAVLPWCETLLYLPKYKVDSHMIQLLIATFSFQKVPVLSVGQVFQSV